MTAEKKIAQKRLTLLQLAERIRNVSQACRHHSISRSQFYEYKRAFQERGFEGFADRPPIPKSFPNETPADVREKVIHLSLQHPAWGPCPDFRSSSSGGHCCKPQYGPQYLDQREHRNQV